MFYVITLPRLSKIYKKIDEASDTLMYFTMNQWRFRNDNTKRLWRHMDDEERKIFYFDMEGLDWKKVIEAVSFGLRFYVEKEPRETIEAGKRRVFKLKVANYVVVGLVFCLVLFFLYRMVLFVC